MSERSTQLYMLRIRIQAQLFECVCCTAHVCPGLVYQYCLRVVPPTNCCRTSLCTTWTGLKNFLYSRSHLLWPGHLKSLSRPEQRKIGQAAQNRRGPSESPIRCPKLILPSHANVATRLFSIKAGESNVCLLSQPMSILTIPKLADELFLRPIVISMNSLALSALMSYVMSANGILDWRPITICVTSDILAIGADHLKDKEEEFSSDRNNANDPRLASWFIYARIFLIASAMLLALALAQCPTSTLLTTAAFVAPALLWTTPISFDKFGLISRRLLGMFGGDKHQSEPPTPAPVLVIKRIPGMKAIFNGIIRGCGIYTVVLSVLLGSGNLTNTLPSPWSVVQLIVWSTVSRSCHAIMTDVRDFEDDLNDGVPTIPVLLGSVLKTKVILTACHMLVMLAFIENQYIMGSCLFAAALVWMLGKDSPKKAFLLSSHSQSLFIIWYLTRQYLQL